MKKAFTALCLFAIAATAAGQSVTLPEKIDGKSGAWIVVVPLKVDGGQPKWRASAGLTEVPLDALFGPEVAKTIKGKVYTAAAAGRYTVEAWNAKADKPSDIATCTVVIDGATPTPPAPPTPPTPPTPDNPAPIPDAGFRFMVVFETDGSPGALTSAQRAALRGANVRGYLTSHCVKEPSGNPGYRYYDQNEDQTNDLPVWKAAMQRKRDSLPWAVISNGKTGFEGPLPATEAEILALLKKYGGD